MRARSPLLLTAQEWRWWFEVEAGEARRLVSVQRALLAAGIDPAPDTALGMSRTVLAAPDAEERLRVLADLWDSATEPMVAAEPGWPPFDGCPGPGPGPARRRCPGGGCRPRR